MDIDTALVARLIGSQFPQWSGLPIYPAEPNGWDNRTFRLGPDLSVRLPSAEGYAAQVRKEQRWLPLLAPHVPLPIPVPVARGLPGAGAVWENALAATWHGRPVWIHGDVAAGNLLVQAGRLAAVIDFGCSGVGDPACDLTIAWTLLSGRAGRRSAPHCRSMLPRGGAGGDGRCGRP